MSDNKKWVIVAGHGVTKRYFCKKGRDYYWYPRTENARIYASAKNARTALARLEKHHRYTTLFPHWDVRVSYLPAVADKQL